MNIMEFIVKEGLIMIPVLYIIGMVITGTQTIADKWIPVILLFIGIGFTPAIVGGYNPENVIQGILVAGATVFGDQLLKQTKRE